MPVVLRNTTGPLRPAENPTSTGILSTQTGVLNPATAPMRTTVERGLQANAVQSKSAIVQIRQRLHSKIVSELRDSVDLSDDIGVRREIDRLFGRFMAEEDVILSRTERAKLQNQVTAEILGYGPIQELINDDAVTEILVNGPSDVWIEQKGRLMLTDIKFQDNEHVMRIINRIVAPLGRHVDEASPMVDA